MLRRIKKLLSTLLTPYYIIISLTDSKYFFMESYFREMVHFPFKIIHIAKILYVKCCLLNCMNVIPMKIKAMPINHFKAKLKHIPIKKEYFYNFFEYLK